MNESRLAPGSLVTLKDVQSTDAPPYDIVVPSEQIRLVEFLEPGAGG